VFVTNDGIVFGSSSDPGAGGLWALRYRPGFAGTVRWNADESNVIVTPTNRKRDPLEERIREFFDKLRDQFGDDLSVR
jgi:hypothetical protein